MAFFDVISEAPFDLAITFLSEVDFKHSNVMPFVVSGHRCDRHWSDDGCTLMMFVKNKKLCHVLQHVTWKSRCGAVYLHQETSEESKTAYTSLVFMVSKANFTVTL